jgi:hypothetical protein
MPKSTTLGLLSIAMLLGAMIVSIPLSAQAQCVGRGCRGPIVGTSVSTTYRYRTLPRVNNVNRYRNVTSTSYRNITRTMYHNVRRVTFRDITRTRYVRHINRIVTVTRVQPIVHVHMVTLVHHQIIARVHTRVVPRVHVAVIPRVHTRTVMLTQNQYASQTRVLPTRVAVVRSSTVLASTRGPLMMYAGPRNRRLRRQ